MWVKRSTLLVVGFAGGNANDLEETRAMARLQEPVLA
jgi:hypothetical protein